MLLVPSDPLDERRPDDYFRPEFLAGRALGLSVGLVDHDALSAGDTERVVRRVSDSGEALYRGWMVRSEQYKALQEALADKAVTLRTKADQYRWAHELPGWYEVFRPLTAQSVWTTGPGVDALSELLGQLPAGPAVVTDWVKSLKHYWREAAFIPDTCDLPTAEAVVQRFLEVQHVEAGQVFTWLPPGVLLDEGSLRHGGLTNAPESRRAALSLVRDFLAVHRDSELWGEEPLAKRSDPLWQNPEHRGTGWFLSEEAYSLGFWADDDARLAIVLSNTWDWEGWGGGAFLSTAPAQRYQSTSELRPEDLAAVARDTRYILCGAFDGEGYVIWRLGDRADASGDSVTPSI